MDFKYRNSIYIYESHLDYMAKQVANGSCFSDVYEDIMMGYYDYDYDLIDFVFDDVEKEVMKRVKNL